MILDLFAGPGGWDEGLRRNGHTDVLGIELDPDACTTAIANGHARKRGDVYGLNPVKVAAGRPVEGAIGSPPCGGLSSAGLGLGRNDLENVQDLLDGIVEAHQNGDPDPRADYLMGWEDLRSPLLAEPMRWTLALNPRWLILEQVDEAMPIWEEYAAHLFSLGWEGVDTAVLDAADYGVPQNRKRAVLVAHRYRPVHLPAPTHGPRGARPWVSMQEALGWPDGAVGFPRRNDRDDGGKYRARDMFDVGGPAQTVTEKARSWTRMSSIRITAMSNAAVRGPEEPAPTLCFGNEVPRWVPGEDKSRADWEAGQRVTVAEAGQLQSFPADYVWTGTPSKQFLQIGNAVPPTLAEAVTRAVIDADRGHPF
jgi:DNA (cytosine-5)-methyltransferase 1